MKILFEHNGIIPVKHYGGTERILFWLMKELVRLGEEVYLVADGRSQVEDIGVRLIDRKGAKGGEWYHLIPKDIDLLHLFYHPRRELDFPVIVTIHGNGQIGEEHHPNAVFLCQKHAENHGADTFVHNGIDLSDYPYQRRAKGKQHFLFLAKGSWKVKNLVGAITACKASHKDLHIAGGRAFGWSRLIHSYGMADHKKKMELLNYVDALLFPVRWHEPFGVAILEAFSQGLPAIVSPFGSLSELVNSRVGVICHSHQELVDKLRYFDNLFDSDEIRTYVEERFSAKIMALNYSKLYSRVIKGERLNRKIPTWQLTNPPQELLPF